MRKYISLIVVLVYVLSLGGCSKSKTFEIPETEKLTIISGTTGESIDITDLDDIKYITERINGVEYLKESKVNGSGWSYGLSWINENGETVEKLTLQGDGYTIIYDGYYYKGTTNNDELLDYLDTQLEK